MSRSSENMYMRVYNFKCIRRVSGINSVRKCLVQDRTTSDKSAQWIVESGGQPQTPDNHCVFQP